LVKACNINIVYISTFVEKDQRRQPPDTIFLFFMKPSGNQDNTITFIPSLFCEPEGRYPIEREGDVTPHHHYVAFTVWGTLCHRRCNTVLETSLAVRDPSYVSYGRRASDPRGFDVEKRRTYTEPSRRALPVPIITSSSHRRRVWDHCRAEAFINSRHGRDHNREMRRRHDLNWSCGV